MSNLVIAIDGPAGSGKSSVSKELAKRLGFGYLDTGAAYRALTWLLLKRQANLETQLSEAEIRSMFAYEISSDPMNFWVRVNGEDVTEAIRSNRVAESVSKIASQPSVRQFMVNLFRNEISEASQPGIVVEGRDITTIVAPDARYRILLTASEAVRLRRRSAQVSDSSAERLARQVSQRDAQDLKSVDFLTPAPGVTLVDSSDLNFEQRVDALLALVETA